jgi:hypothetical protein
MKTEHLTSYRVRDPMLIGTLRTKTHFRLHFYLVSCVQVMQRNLLKEPDNQP